MKNFEKIAYAYALRNAISYEGKAQQGSVISALFNEGLKKEDMKKYGKEIGEIVKKVNSISLKEQEKEFEKVKDLVSERPQREGLPELSNTENGVVMRIAPSPSGPLHAMHAIVASYSYLYVKKYGGKFYVRIEDTNPENIYSPAYKLIQDEIRWLFGDLAEIVIQSSRIDIYYKYAEKLIKKDAAYVCTCSQDDFKKFSEGKKNCPCRKLSVKENSERWKKMLDKKGFKEGEAVLRFKTPKEGMKHKNPAMRDFPLARINEVEHPKQGKRYRVWPLMNLAVAVDDIEEKMTHIIRGKDHRDNALRQEMIFEVLGKKYPWTAFVGRVNFKEKSLSTSQTRKDIEAGKYSGWDDSRLLFLQYLKKKYKPSTFWKMAMHLGISEVDKSISEKDFFELLDTFNRE